MKILSLESSTTSAKAMLYDTETKQTLLDSLPYPAAANLPDGTQDAKVIFDLTAQVGRKVAAGLPVDAVALVGAWHSVMLCGQDCEPVTRVYSWAATHAATICAPLRKDPEAVNAYYQKTGCMVNAIYPYFKLQYLRAQGWKLEDYLIMGQGSYNTWRLTGRRVLSDCMASGTGLMNLRTRRFDPELLESIGIREEQLCEIIHYDAPLSLNEEGAALLGLKAGTPLIAACSDGGMNQIAVGGYREGVMSFSVGTSAAIRLTVKEPCLPESPSTWCYLSPVGYLSGAATSGACNCLSWFKDSFMPGVSYEEIEKQYRFDRDTPVFLPFLFGERCPGWDDSRKGGFGQMTGGHVPMDCYQAICEGILFCVYQCYEKLLTVNKLDPKIILSGGILNSPAWTQMCADIFNHEMCIPENAQSSLWGGVVLAVQQRLGDEGADELMGACSSVQPDAARHEVYMKKYAKYLEQYENTACGR